MIYVLNYTIDLVHVVYHTYDIALCEKWYMVTCFFQQIVTKRHYRKTFEVGILYLFLTRTLSSVDF